MQITAQMVKELRERTGAAMMDCKRALEECKGDMDAAAELMRKSGQAKADKKSSRIAAQGAIGLAADEAGGCAALIEVNSETDFVAKGDDFVGFARTLAGAVLAHSPLSLEDFKSAKLKDGQAAETSRLAMIARIGENIQIRRFERLCAQRVGTYLHGRKIGVIVGMEGGDAELAKDIAMHIAASRPVCVSENEVSAELLAKEREIYLAQAQESGKPPAIIEKMVDGRVKKFVTEITLLGQPFVKDTEMSVEKLLKSRGARVTGFYRMEVGEGIEKKKEDFAAEVMSQVQKG
jgi:elongation factor Ts